MPLAIVLPLAEVDLEEIWLYIAQDSLQNAGRFVDRIFRTCRQTLANNPRIGRNRSELGPGLRSFSMDDFIIFYRPIEGGAEVIRRLHGNRDIEQLF